MSKKKKTKSNVLPIVSSKETVYYLYQQHEKYFPNEKVTIADVTIKQYHINEEVFGMVMVLTASPDCAITYEIPLFKFVIKNLSKYFGKTLNERFIAEIIPDENNEATISKIYTLDGTLIDYAQEH